MPFPQELLFNRPWIVSALDIPLRRLISRGMKPFGEENDEMKKTVFVLVWSILLSSFAGTVETMRTVDELIIILISWWIIRCISLSKTSLRGGLDMVGSR